MTVGSRAEVFHGNATQTSGGLVKKDLKNEGWAYYLQGGEQGFEEVLQDHRVQGVCRCGEGEIQGW